MVPAIFLSVMMTGHIIPQVGFGAELLDAAGNNSGVYLLEKSTMCQLNLALPLTPTVLRA